MKNLFLFSSLMIYLFFAVSCSKDDDATPDPTQIPESFSELTVEQNKAQLEQNGMTLVDEMTEFKNTSAMKVSANLFTLLNSSSVDGGRKMIPLLETMNNLEQENNNLYSVFSAMRISGTSTTEDPETLQELYESVKGVYTWNPSIDDWEIESVGDKLVFKFPSSSTKTTNNAVLTVHSYKGVVLSSLISDTYSGDLPTQLLMDLTVDGTKVMDYGFKASYDSKGIPTLLETFFNLVPFTLTAKFTNSTKAVTIDYSLQKSGKILIGMGANAVGNFTESGLTSAEGPESVLNEAKAYFQFMDVRMAGNINFKGYLDGIEGIDTEEESAYAAAEANVLNNNMNMAIFYVSNLQKIAETEFYTYEDTYSYTYEYYNWSTGNYETVTEEYTETMMDVRLIFSDGSKSDLETYVNTGFGNLERDLSNFLTDLENSLE